MRWGADGIPVVNHNVVLHDSAAELSGVMIRVVESENRGGMRKRPRWDTGRTRRTMAVQSAIGRLERAGWKITQHGGPSRTPRGDGHVSWVAAWARPWAGDPETQVQIEVNCRGTPEAALSRLLHLAETIANDEASATSPGREVEEVAVVASGREVSLSGNSPARAMRSR